MRRSIRVSSPPCRCACGTTSASIAQRQESDQRLAAGLREAALASSPGRSHLASQRPPTSLAAGIESRDACARHKRAGASASERCAHAASDRCLALARRSPAEGRMPQPAAAPNPLPPDEADGPTSVVPVRADVHAAGVAVAPLSVLECRPCGHVRRSAPLRSRAGTAAPDARCAWRRPPEVRRASCVSFQARVRRACPCHRRGCGDGRA